MKDSLQCLRLELIFGVPLMNFSGQYEFDQSLSIQNSSIKMGLQTVTTLHQDEIFSFYCCYYHFNADDALLNLLWRYKGRIDSYTVNCL